MGKWKKTYQQRKNDRKVKSTGKKINVLLQHIKRVPMPHYPPPIKNCGPSLSLSELPAESCDKCVTSSRATGHFQLHRLLSKDEPVCMLTVSTLLKRTMISSKLWSKIKMANEIVNLVSIFKSCTTYCQRAHCL